ncbi:hypothetical protein LJR168_003789 [Pseudoxanthomonas sp. LjRoot168]|uniref:hypothetical protein n=1 Tax=unclassified Pseudoxanthomonas TaxID=2645906 RepID=UPI003ECE0AB5
MSIAKTLLTPPQRAELIEKLSSDTFSSAHGDRGFLLGMITEGFRGFSKLGDAELLKCHRDAFDEDFAYEATAVSQAPVLLIACNPARNTVSFSDWSPEISAHYEGKLQATLDGGARAAEFSVKNRAFIVLVDGENDAMFEALQAATGVPAGLFEKLREDWYNHDLQEQVVGGIVLEGADVDEVFQGLERLINVDNSDIMPKGRFDVEPVSYVRTQHTGDILYEVFDDGDGIGDGISILTTSFRRTLDDAPRLEVSGFELEGSRP